MGLSDDQKALLRLLAGGQGYEDIAALLGTGVEEVEAKAAAAAEQLEAEGIPAPTLPAAGRSLTPAPADPEPPSDPPSSTAVAPEKGVLPDKAVAPDKAAKPAAAGPVETPSPSSAGRPRLSLPSDPGKRAALAAAAIVVALIAVVLIVNGGGGSDQGTTSAGATTGESGETESGSEARNAANANGKVTKAVLTSVGGGEASGVAIFGRVKKSLALQLQAQGLEPTGSNDEYTVWVADSPRKMLPLASTAVKKDGRIAAQFEVPVEVLAYLAAETFDRIVVTRTETAKLRAALKKATEEEKSPAYTGEEVLSGQVTGPIIGAEKRVEEREARKKE